MNRGNNRGPASGAVGVFGCGGGGSEDNGASGGGGGYSGGGGGGVVVPVGNKPEVKEARTVMAKIVQVWPVGTQMMMALCKL